MFKLSATYENTLAGNGARVQSIDVLRGIMLVLMMLDHTRVFFHTYALDYAPTDLTYSTPIVFYTYWISAVCAPAFIFLTGLSAFLYRYKNHSDNRLFAKYLVLRGAILILIDLVVGQIGNYFYLASELNTSAFSTYILWSIGWGMIALSALIYLPRNVIGIFGLAILLFHNFLDGIGAQSNLILDIIWAFLHQGIVLDSVGEIFFFFEYPIIPVIGIMSLGYYVGKWYTTEYLNEVRTGYLFYIGVAAMALFVSMRFFQFFTEQYSYVFYLNHKDALDIAKTVASNEQNQDLNWRLFFKENMFYLIDNYGDPSPWKVYDSLSDTTMSFFNTTKQPMSLLFSLMALGPLLILMSFIDLKNNFIWRIFETFGRVPLFFYLIHFVLLNSIALIFIYYFEGTASNIGEFFHWVTLIRLHGFSIPGVYLIAIVELVFMFLFCYGYGKLRSSKKHKIYTFL